MSEKTTRTGKCKRCKKTKRLEAKGMCFYCYSAYGRRQGICKDCKKNKSIFAKGLCKNCYNKLNYYHLTKAYNIRKWHNGLDFELYKKITKECMICKFDIIVELHHIDKNHNNNKLDNLTGLCPNHHKMAHMDKYKEFIASEIKKVRSPL